MNFVESIGSAFAKYGVADGRASRSEYWWFLLFYLGLIVIGGFLNTAVASGFDNLDAMLWWLTWSPLSNVPMLAMFLPMLMLGIRRMHDINKSGTWVLVSFVPIFGWVYWFYLAAQEGDTEENAYGVNPKLDWLNAETTITQENPVNRTKPEVVQKPTETKKPAADNFPEAKKSRETLEKIPPKSNLGIDTIDPIGSHKDAFLLMEYNSKIEDIFNAIKHLPDSYQDRFLVSVTEEKIESLFSLKDDLIKEYDREINPFDKSEYNDLYKHALSLSKEAAEEVKTVMRLSNDNIDVKEIKKKIDKKFTSLEGIFNYINDKNIEITRSIYLTGTLHSILFGDQNDPSALRSIAYYLNDLGMKIDKDSSSDTWRVKVIGFKGEGHLESNPLTLEQLFSEVQKMIEKLGVSRSDWGSKS